MKAEILRLLKKILTFKKPLAVVSAAMLIFSLLAGNIEGFCRAFTVSSCCIILCVNETGEKKPYIRRTLYVNLAAGLITGGASTAVSAVICRYFTERTILFSIANLLCGLIILSGFTLCFSGLNSRQREKASAALLGFITLASTAV